MSKSQITQYIIVRKDLLNQLGAGVIATQVAHASMAPITARLRSNPGKTIDDIFDKETKEWINGRFTKIVLEVNDKPALLEIMTRLSAEGIEYFSMQENTLDKEITSIGLKPYNKGKIAPYFKHLRLLEQRKEKIENNQEISVLVNEQKFPPNRIGYSLFDLDKKNKDFANRFTLELDAKKFITALTHEYESARQFSKTSSQGSGVEYIDKLGFPSLDYIKKNDLEFNKYLIDSYSRELLDAILPKENEKKNIIITSINGIFYRLPKIFIYGSCCIK